jgi:hypothetical protein
MIPANLDPTWYETYWYGVRRRHMRRHPRMIDATLLAAGLLFAVLVVGAALLVLFGPTPPLDAAYAVT